MAYHHVLHGIKSSVQSEHSVYYYVYFIRNIHNVKFKLQNYTPKYSHRYLKENYNYIQVVRIYRAVVVFVRWLSSRCMIPSATELPILGQNMTNTKSLREPTQTHNIRSSQTQSHIDSYLAYNYCHHYYHFHRQCSLNASGIRAGAMVNFAFLHDGVSGMCGVHYQALQYASALAVYHI